LMIDIDHFKRYNDHYGHPQGDECLRQVAQAIQALVHRPADAFARFGGEEFVALLPDTDETGARHVAQQIVSCVAGRMIPHAQSLVVPYVTVSVGASTVVWPVDAAVVQGQHQARAPGWRAADLMRCADKALYAAKHAGRGCSRFTPLTALEGG
jgi:diguanylate cyclase (GGDEF)-like protein